jgi:beta-lactamase superfamily II metal-dependent hydrolase
VLVREATGVAGDDDTSVTNLSSVVFLAEYETRTILMTGDARGDYIVDGLDRAGRLQGGTAHVDILKLQHHGSARNIDTSFFQTVTADHYIIAANGMYGNPDLATFDALVKARGQTGYSVWLTNGAAGTPLAATVAAVNGS